MQTSIQLQSPWIDLLPQDTLHRIALHVSRGTRNNHALRLAQSTHIQRNAVLSALKYTFHINWSEKTSGEVPHPWAPIFAPAILEFHLPSFDRFPPETVTKLFTAPTLKRLSVYRVRTPQLHFFHQRSWSDVRVTLGLVSDIPARQVLDLVQHVRPWKITFQDRVKSRFRKFYNFDTQLQKKLKQAFQTVTHINYSYSNNGPNAHFHKFWIEVLQSLPNPQQVTINQPVPPELLPVLKRFETVIHTDDSVAALSQLKELGSRVQSALYWHTDVQNYTPLGTLDDVPATFPCLNSLALTVPPGIETRLHALLSGLPNLRELYVEIDLPPAQDDVIHPFHPSPPGVIGAAFECRPKLTLLRFENIVVPQEELVSILTSLGPTIQDFSINMESDDEQALHTVIALVLTAANYCHVLRSFCAYHSVLIPIPVDNLQLESADGSEAVTEEVDVSQEQTFRELRHTLSVAIARMQCNAPWLHDAYFGSLVTAVPP